MIKFAKRRNIIYILQLIFWNIARVMIRCGIKLFCDYDRPPVLEFVSFLGKFTGGLIVINIKQNI